MVELLLVFLLGLSIGAVVGVGVISLCVISSRSDKALEVYHNKTHNKK